MLKKGVMALFIIVAISSIIIGAFAISNNKNSSNNIASNQLTPLNTPLNNTSSSNTSVPVVNSKSSNSNGKVNTNGVVSVTSKNSPESDSVRSTTNHNKIDSLSSVTIISPVKAQEIAAKYIEQTGATPGTPDLISQNDKKVYIVPVIDNNVNVGEIDLDAHDGSNLGGAGGVKN
jgi:hypothetical protein